MSTKRPILIVEDDDAFRQVLVDQIAAIGIFRPPRRQLWMKRAAISVCRRLV
jgi:hypothetical protein